MWHRLQSVISSFLAALIPKGTQTEVCGTIGKSRRAALPVLTAAYFTTKLLPYGP